MDRFPTRDRRSPPHLLVAGLTAVIALAHVVRSKADETSYHIDLTRYLITQSTEKSDRAQLIPALEAWTAQAPDRRDPKVLEAYLQNAEAWT